MLYSLYQTAADMMLPMRVWATAAGQGLSAGGDLESWRAAGALCEMVSRATLTHRRPSFGITESKVGNRVVPVREEEIFATPFGTLLRDTVRVLLPEHDVHITDWANARDVGIWHGRFGFDEYVEHLMWFLRAMGPGAHVVAVCQPCVQALAAAALMAEDDHPCQPLSLTLMAGPIDTRINPTKVNELATGQPISWFERNLIARVPLRYPGATRRVYPGFLQLTSFISMNLDRHINAHMRQFEHLVKGDDDSADGHRAFYDEYLAVMDLTAEFYLQTIEVVFKEHLLPRGEWISRGRTVDPSAIETALMTVEGELDDISGIGQTKAAHALTPNIPGARHVHWEQPRVGHYGIFNGRKWREQIMPRVRDFIRANDGR